MSPTRSRGRAGSHGQPLHTAHPMHWRLRRRRGTKVGIADDWSIVLVSDALRGIRKRPARARCGIDGGDVEQEISVGGPCTEAGVEQVEPADSMQVCAAVFEKHVEHVRKPRSMLSGIVCSLPSLKSRKSERRPMHKCYLQPAMCWCTADQRGVRH